MEKIIISDVSYPVNLYFSLLFIKINKKSSSSSGNANTQHYLLAFERNYSNSVQNLILRLCTIVEVSTIPLVN